MPSQKYAPPQPNFVPVRVKGKLVFEFDRRRGIIRLVDRGEAHLIDLAEYGGNDGQGSN